MNLMEENIKSEFSESKSGGMKTKSCLQCGREFQTYRRTQKFCSQSCWTKWRMNHDPVFKEKVHESARRANTKYPLQLEEVLELYIVQNLSLKEVSEKLGIPMTALKVKLRKWNLRKPKELVRDLLKGKTNTPKRTREDCIRMYKELVEKEGRYLNSQELAKLGYEDLRHSIFRRFGSFPNFLKALGVELPSIEELKLKHQEKIKLSRQERFRLFSSMVSSRYNFRDPSQYTEGEEKVRKILSNHFGLVEGRDFFHNFKLLKYYLDFYLPKFKLCIEKDSLWHRIGDVEWRDRKRDLVLQSLGIRTLRFEEEREEKIVALLEPFLKEVSSNEDQTFNRQESDDRKRLFLESHGIKLVDIQDVKDLEGVFR